MNFDNENNDSNEIAREMMKKQARFRVFMFVFFMILATPFISVLIVDRWVLNPQHSIFGPQKAIELKKEVDKTIWLLKFKYDRNELF